ncbi:MAG TPA: endopeptidase La [Dehalococcoidia bacterium]
MVEPERVTSPEEAPAPPDVIPVIAAGPNVLFPAVMAPLLATEPREVAAMDAAAGSAQRLVGIFAQEPSGPGTYQGPLRRTGTAATIVRMARTPAGAVQAIVQGTARVRLVALEQEQPYPQARVLWLEERAEETPEVEALRRSVADLFRRVAELAGTIPAETVAALSQAVGPGNLADFVAANVPTLGPEERQQVLETLDVAERLRLLVRLLTHEVQVLEVGQQIQSQVRGELDRRQREFILREQLRTIQRELGEEGTPELAELERRLDEAKLPPEARREADRELQRLRTMPQASAEYQVARTYLEWLADLPWAVSTEDNLDIDHAERVLNEDHYGLARVKQRILDFLAVRKLRQDAKGPILCFVGPPGVGKTSLGQSIARALGRRFVRMSLGGVRDEAEIRGHRRTYVGALPGRIIQGIRRAGSNNPVFMLDEVDKLGADFRGDPSAALLEVLDPAQNAGFVDHYLDVPFDLSRVFFITTANVLDTIPAPLRDRMEIIEIPGYTELEKLEIGKRYLLPRQVRENGLPEGALALTDGALREIIRSYTREAGVRNLEREIAAVCRGVARHVARDPTRRFTVRPEDLPEYLGPPRFRWEAAREADEVGVATGLAWTPYGGDVLFVEARAVPGKGRLTLTGQLGSVMQESAQAALTYARSRAEPLRIPPDFFERHDLHVHVPAGAIPKDGPSAGVTMATALVSAITRRPVRRDVAMTGEITLRGKVLPVGGIRDKVLAAHRMGVRTVVLPKDNERDLEEVPPEVRSELQFVLAEDVDTVLNTALHQEVREEQPHLAPTAV